MYNLNNITFITFVRIDNDERAANLQAMYSYYKNTCENYTHILIEDDTECKVPSILDLTKNDTCVFTKSSVEWQKSAGFNKGIKLAQTNILTLIDTDIIIHPKQLLETANMLSEDDNFGLMYPYNGMFLCAEKPLKDRFCESRDYDTLHNEMPDIANRFQCSHNHTKEDLKRLILTEYGDVTIGHLTSKGGCVMARRDNLIRCNGYNPNFIGWGYEDDELPSRIARLGCRVRMLAGNGNVCWHLYHFDGTGSQKEDQPNHDHNKQLFEKIMSMDPTELLSYIRTWRL